MNTDADEGNTNAPSEISNIHDGGYNYAKR